MKTKILLCAVVILQSVMILTLQFQKTKLRHVVEYQSTVLEKQSEAVESVGRTMEEQQKLIRLQQTNINRMAKLLRLQYQP